MYGVSCLPGAADDAIISVHKTRFYVPPPGGAASVGSRIVRPLKIRRSRRFFFYHKLTERKKIMAWVYLLTAGALECVWSTFMKMSDGFSRPLFTILTIAGLAGSMAALVAAVKTLPISLAYPIWTGIGAAGAVVIGVLVFKDHLSPLAWFFLILLVVSVIGLQAASGK